MTNKEQPNLFGKGDEILNAIETEITELKKQHGKLLSASEKALEKAEDVLVRIRNLEDAIETLGIQPHMEEEEGEHEAEAEASEDEAEEFEEPEEESYIEKVEMVDEVLAEAEDAPAEEEVEEPI